MDSEEEAEEDMVLQWALWDPWVQWDLWGLEVQGAHKVLVAQDSEDEEVQDFDLHHRVTEALHLLAQEALDLDTEAHPHHLIPTGALCPHHHQEWEAQWDHLECHQWVLWVRWDLWVHQDRGVDQWDHLGDQEVQGAREAHLGDQIKTTKISRILLGEWT